MSQRIGRTIVILAAVYLCARPVFGGEPGESRFATCEDKRVHYTNYGSGSPALLFVHGWACDETVWRAQAPELGQKIHTITIDLPGHGQSDKPEMRYTMDLYARAMDAVLSNAHVGSAILVGHSNGTPAIRQFYRQYPAKVRALVIVDGPLRQFFDAAAMEKFIAPFRGDGYEQAATRMIDGITRPMPDESNRAQIRQMMLRTPQHVAVSEFENTASPELWKPDKIEVPVLMIMAKQPAWTAEYEQFVRGFIPDLDYQMWENVSHFLMVDKPHEFNEALLAFLEKHQLLLRR